jgi:hypothetical protein
LNPSTLALDLFQFPDANQKSPNEFVRVGSVMYFTHYHEGGTLTAMGVAGSSTPPTPSALGFSDRINLIDSLGGQGGATNEIAVGDAFLLIDDLDSGRTQGTPNSDTLELTDSVALFYLGGYSFSDSLSLSEGSGVWNTTYFDGLSFLEDLQFLVQEPQPVPLPGILISDSLELFDSRTGGDPQLGFLGFGDRIVLTDKQGTVMKSTLDGYLRRYLNDVLPR